MRRVEAQRDRFVLAPHTGKVRTVFEDAAGRPGRFVDPDRATPYDVGSRVKLINPTHLYYPQSGELVHDNGHRVYVRHDNGDVMAYPPDDIRSDEDPDTLDSQRWNTAHRRHGEVGDTAYSWVLQGISKQLQALDVSQDDQTPQATRQWVGWALKTIKGILADPTTMQVDRINAQNLLWEFNRLPFGAGSGGLPGGSAGGATPLPNLIV